MVIVPVALATKLDISKLASAPSMIEEMSSIRSSISAASSAAGVPELKSEEIELISSTRSSAKLSSPLERSSSSETMSSTGSVSTSSITSGTNPTSSSSESWITSLLPLPTSTNTQSKSSIVNGECPQSSAI